MTPEAQKLLNHLNKHYKKAALHAINYRGYNLPEVAMETLSLPADSWNAGNDSRIEIQKGAHIRLVLSEETYALGVGGTDTDRLMGLWVSAFTYKGNFG